MEHYVIPLQQLSLLSGSSTRMHSYKQHFNGHFPS